MIYPCHPCAFSRIPRRGFSLIELLVVVVIIGVLAGILFPVFSRIRQNSLGALATNQMREMGQAVFLYASEHSNNLPGPAYSGQGFRFKDERPGFLMSSIGVYLGQKEPSWQWEYVDLSFLTGPQRDFYDQTGESAIFYSVKVTGDVVPFGYTVTEAEPLKLNTIENPSEVFMLREVDQKAEWAYSSWSSRIPSKPLHGDARHISYFDGHVTAYPRSETDQE